MFRGVIPKQNLSLQRSTDPVNDHLGHLASRVQDEGVAETFLTQNDIGVWEIPPDVVEIIHGAPVIWGSVIKYQLKTSRDTVDLKHGTTLL